MVSSVTYRLRTYRLEESIDSRGPSGGNEIHPASRNLWIPLVLTDKERTDHDTGWLNVLGRLKPGVASASAQQAMSGIAAGLEKQYPDTNKNSGVVVSS